MAHFRQFIAVTDEDIPVQHATVDEALELLLAVRKQLIPPFEFSLLLQPCAEIADRAIGQLKALCLHMERKLHRCITH